MARLLLDENVARSVADHLDREGHDVLTLREANLEGASDEEVVHLARREGRVVVTCDRDFLGGPAFPTVWGSA